LVAIKLKETKEPKEMMQMLMQEVVEGNLVWSSLHSFVDEFHQLFDMVNDWASLFDQRIQPIMKLCAQLNNMHAKSRAMTDPVKHATKFAKIQAKDEQLDVMDESIRAAKKDLHNFHPIVQA
jgi:hypothetical protein